MNNLNYLISKPDKHSLAQYNEPRLISNVKLSNGANKMKMNSSNLQRNKEMEDSKSSIICGSSKNEADKKFMMNE